MKQTHSHQTSLPKLQTRELTFDVASFAPNQKVATHSHENAFFCMALQGVCTESYGRKIRVYKPSVLSFLPAGETHSLEFYKTGMRSFSIEIKPPLVARMLECSLKSDDSVHCQGGQLTLLFKKVYSEFFQIDDVTPLAVEGLVLEMLAEVSRRRLNKDSQQSPQWLKTVTEIIHDQFSEALTLDDIAKSAGVHPVYLSRVFRRHYRCTIGDYIRRLRVEYASHQILTSKATLLEIAMTAGFSDQSHFSRIFKRQMGITPTEYRSMCSRS